MRTILLITAAVVVLANAAHADIYQWEYINPADPSQGKRQSTTLASDGAGVDAVPGANISWRNLTMAYLAGADLTGAFGEMVNLANADLSNANLTIANLNYANLTNTVLNGAVLTGANVWGANFTGSDLTLAQLYSTANYVNGYTFSGIGLANMDLSGANFANKLLDYANFSSANLSGADFSGANAEYADFTSANLSVTKLTNGNFARARLTDAELTGADLRGADFGISSDCPTLICFPIGTGLTPSQLYSTASYQNGDLSGIRLVQNNLAGANLAGQNLTNADFTGATLTDADFSGTEVRGADFGKGFRCITFCFPIGTEITRAQLYSTASYQAHDLTGIGLSNNDLAGANFAGQNLTNANFLQATLTAADLTGAEIRGANFYNTTARGFTAAQLYSTASYQAHDLTRINLEANDLSGWNFAGQNLTNASFVVATLTGADFAGAEVRGATFGHITLAQLYSTASYQAHDLSGIGLSGNSLIGANFTGQKLANADFSFATTTDADFTGADVRGANFSKYSIASGITLAQLYSTASYQAYDLSGIDLRYNNFAGANFAGQKLENASVDVTNLSGASFREANLTKASFSNATLTGADFTGAEVRGADFNRNASGGTGITLAQLYSTASYQTGDLSGISLFENNLAGANFVSQNLTNAYFYDATLTDVNFTAADARGADYFNDTFAFAIKNNLIHPNGHIIGLELNAGGLLPVRDYDGNPNHIPPTDPIPITIDHHFAMGAGGTLRMVFESDAWDSTISFAPGIPVTLGGTLDLTFADDVNPATQLGRTFDLFDWTGVSPTGAFDVDSPYRWNLANLYTTGEVTLTAVPEPTTLAMLLLGALVILAPQYAGIVMPNKRKETQLP